LGELGEQKQQSRVDLWQIQVDEIRFRQEMIAAVRKALADVLLADVLADLGQKKAAKADERLRIIEQLVDQGERSIINLSKAKIWRAETQNELVRARQNQRLTRQELSQQTGIDQTALIIQDELPQLNVDLDALINLALELRPELELVSRQIELARQQKQFETLKLIPWFNFVEVSYHSEQPGDEDWGEFTTGINLPLFDWNLGNIRATQLAVKSHEVESEAAKELIVQEVHSAFLVHQDLWLDYTTFRATADEFVLSTTDVIDQARLHKTLMADDVVDLECAIYDTQILLAEKRREVAHALFDLYLALGIEEDVEPIR
jgi:outer membrane protein TolC